jgi:hypothetical protein
VRNLAGDVLQVVSPRAADDDCVIQREAPGEYSACCVLSPLSEAQSAYGHSLL